MKITVPKGTAKSAAPKGTAKNAVIARRPEAGEAISIPRLLRSLCPLAMTIFWISSTQHAAYAVVGQAEEYDQFDRADLEAFHEELVNEEELHRQQEADEMVKILKDRKKEIKKAAGAEKEIIQEQVINLEKELLQLPKRDRFRLEMGGQQQYDSNIVRAPLRMEKGDSVFDANAAGLVDLSGRKTDLRFEVQGAKQWNIHFPEKDFSSAEERIRYRRKYFKKMTHSLQSRIARTSSKTPEIDEKKIRWDSFQNTAMNYAMTRKLSFNYEMNANKRYFQGEPFDQDSSWDVSFAPSAFWNFTPKSRISLGYNYGANRIRTKSSDTNSHEVHAAYFGKITNKTSTSSDWSYAHQIPRSLRAPKVNTVTVGKGIIWQATPKTQATLQFIRSVQNTTSNSVAGADQNTTVKTDSHFNNDSLTLSLNHRMNNRLTAVLTTNVSHVRTKTQKGLGLTPDAEQDLETRQFLFPTSLNVTYFLRRWIRLQMGYTFTYRTGDERADKFRSHNVTSSVHMVM